MIRVQTVGSIRPDGLDEMSESLRARLPDDVRRFLFDDVPDIGAVLETDVDGAKTLGGLLFQDVVVVQVGAIREIRDLLDAATSAAVISTGGPPPSWAGRAEALCAALGVLLEVSK